ncbi:hypothetical protein [Nonomuraea guangzhouensis]|uniref:Uncharacterized protein n=1 Tax=Nonomuraea guangzhouensis TaxID=1291555 RepID=A0ABW4GNQ2_9ACTN|nr:hypothetical protein [Nonomuraea guangzhouensis]
MTATLLAGCLVLATSCGAPAPAKQAPASAPQAPVTTDPVASGPVATTPTKSPKPVKPTGDTINTHKVRWTKAQPTSHGRKLKLTWWSGVAPCSVLDRVKVKETGKRVTVTLYEGTAPKAKDVACIMIAVEKTTTVKLKSPLGKRKVVDGAKS